MTRLLRIALAALSLLAGPAFAGDKPLVIESGQTKQLPAGTALNIGQGSAPGSLVNGDLWATSSGFYGSAGSFTFGPFGPPMPNPFCYTGTGPCYRYGAGVPGSTPDPKGSIYQDVSTPDVYQQITAGGSTGVLVQAINAAHAVSVTLPSAPLTGDMLVAACWGYGSGGGLAAGWTDTGIGHAPNANEPGDHWGYKFAIVGEPATQTPCITGSNPKYGVTLYELSGVNNWSASYEGSTFLPSISFSGSSIAVNYTTANNGDLLLASYFTQGAASTGTVSGLANTIASVAAGSEGIVAADQVIPANGTVVSTTGTFSGGVASGRVLALRPPLGVYRKLSFLTGIKSGGSSIETEPFTLNFSTGLSATSDGAGNVTVTGSGGSAANPTATASDTAVNGTASTFMRSDASPAIQKASSSQFGLVKVDGTTITATGGVISSVGGSGTVTVSGTPTTGNCVKFAGSTSITDAGAACGSGGGGGTTNNYYASGLVLLEQHTASNSAELDFTNWYSSNYDIYQIEVDGIVPSTNADLEMQLSTDGGATYGVSSNMDWANHYFGVNTTSDARQGATSVNYWNIAGTTLSSTSTFGVLATIKLAWPGSTTQYKRMSYTTALNTTSNSFGAVGSGTFNSTTAVNAFRFIAASGNLAAGTIRVYGIPNSATVPVNPQPGLPVICSIVTSGSATSVTVGGGSGPCPTIPSTYRDLEVVVSGANSSDNQYGILRFNGDSSSSYTYGQYTGYSTSSQQFLGSGTTATTGMQRIFFTGGTAFASTIKIFNYASSTAPISVASETSTLGAASGNTSGIATGTWNPSTKAAVTSLTLSLQAGNFVDGTVVTVYGIGGSPTATLPVVPPQGRLTLTSNTPVMSADAVAQTTIYWTPYVGNLMPVGNVMYRVPQISFALNTTAHVSGSLYDVFAYNASGAIALCTGPAWTSSTARSAAIQMDPVNAIWENAAALTCTLSGSTTTTTIAPAQATYLGTFYATANGQTGMAFHPTAAAGGTNNILGLWNAYNRVRITALNRDSTATFTKATTTPSTLNASNANRIAYVDGLGQSAVDVTLQMPVAISNAVDECLLGVDLNSTSATSQVYAGSAYTNVTQMAVNDNFVPTLGFNYAQAMESTAAGGTCTYYSGVNSTQQGGLTAALQM